MKNILVVAPHPDDEILGCGGTMLKEIAKGNNVYVCIVTHGEPPVFKEGVSLPFQKAARECHKWMGVEKTFFLDFPSTMLEKVDRYLLNKAILDVVREVNANVVYVPHYGDMQKDHQIVADACMVAVRPTPNQTVTTVYGYETLSETAWNTPNVQNEFIPNTYEDISEYIDGKIEAMEFYSGQLKEFPNSRSLRTLRALAEYRGSLMNMKAGEAFMLLRDLR